MFFGNYIVKVTDFFIQKNTPIYTNILPQQELTNLKPAFLYKDMA